jgi:3-phenylpropionate/trans-cinnamate dioxygenase ferredoxin reductase component
VTLPPRSVVIAGGGIAGVSSAAALRVGGYDGAVTIVDAGDYPHDRPPLSKDFLTGKRDRDDIVLQPSDWYVRHEVRLLTGTAVTAVRPGSGAVELSDGATLHADRVVLATGGRAARPPIPGVDSPLVHVLRTVEDAERLRAALQSADAVMVVGAGLIGSEVAATLHGSGYEVVLVDPMRPPLAAALGMNVAHWLHDLHSLRGIACVQASVESFAEDGGRLRVQLAGESQPRVVDLAVLGVGMVPDSDLAVSAGLEVDRGIVVDVGQRTSNAAVLAVGDAARTRVAGTLLPRTEHWDAAQQDGARAAATILGRPVPPATASWFWTDRHGLHVEVVGEMAAAANRVVRGALGTPPFTVFGLREGRLVAAVAVDDSATARVARRLIDRAVAVEENRLADPDINLRALLRV